MVRDGAAPVPLYVLLGWAVSVAGAVLLITVASSLFPHAAEPRFDRSDPALLFFLVVAFSPFVETCLMSVPLLLLEPRLGRPRSALASAALWGVLHSLSAPIWGVPISWSFFIFSLAFMAWRGKRGYWWGVGVAATIHACQNATVAWTLLL